MLPGDQTSGRAHYHQTHVPIVQTSVGAVHTITGHTMVEQHASRRLAGTAGAAIVGKPEQMNSRCTDLSAAASRLK
jgi:hypothetical protein